MSSSLLQEVSNGVAEAVAKGSASTVMVAARDRYPCSGIIYDGDLILSADHVVERDSDIRIGLPAGESVRASVVGRDVSSDLALLRLEDGSVQRAETSADVEVGRIVLALGRPNDGGIQASLGVVSALGGPWQGGALDRFIMTDATGYPGFSGGPLVDVDGRLIGMNTYGSVLGQALTIPIDIAWTTAKKLLEHGTVKRGYLGIRSQAVDLPETVQDSLGRRQVEGLLVVGVEDGSPAALASLMVGDILAGFGGVPITDHRELLGRLKGDIVGTAVEIEIIRGGRREIETITVGEIPADSPRSRGSRRRARRR